MKKNNVVVWCVLQEGELLAIYSDKLSAHERAGSIGEDQFNGAAYVERWLVRGRRTRTRKGGKDE